MNAFNPANPQYRRGVSLLSVYICTLVGANVLMSDFGSQEHVFSPLHRYVNKKLDTFFNVQDSDIADAQLKKKLADREIVIYNADLTRLMGGAFNGGDANSANK